MPTLHEETRFQRFRRRLRAHAWIEPVIFLGLFHPYVWLIAPMAKTKNIIAVTVILVAIPFLSVLFHRDQLKDMGVRFDNIRQSAREVAIMTFWLSMVILLFGMWSEWSLQLNERTLPSIVKYLPWGLGQQFVLQSFVYRRLRQSFYPPLAMGLAALMFGTAHFPNYLLMATCAGAGYFWCRAFERTPNIFTLALSHVVLGTLLASETPYGMSIGPRFW